MARRRDGAGVGLHDPRAREHEADCEGTASSHAGRIAAGQTVRKAVKIVRVAADLLSV